MATIPINMGIIFIIIGYFALFGNGFADNYMIMGLKWPGLKVFCGKRHKFASAALDGLYLTKVNSTLKFLRRLLIFNSNGKRSWANGIKYWY
jgi:hypothetical protein